MLKSISGNDPQAIDRKGIDELPRVRLFCRFSIAVNELPKLPDEAGAIKTRLLLLHFRNSYAGREDTTLKPRLKDGSGGHSKLGLGGTETAAYPRAIYPSRPQRVMIEAFEKLVSPVLGFLDDCCELGGGDDPIWIEKNDLYAGWCAGAKIGVWQKAARRISVSPSSTPTRGSVLPNADHAGSSSPFTWGCDYAIERRIHPVSGPYLGISRKNVLHIHSLWALTFRIHGIRALSQLRAEK